MILPFRFQEILRLDETPSTQDFAEAIVRCEHGDKRPHVVFAKHQTQGRGRFDRKWESAEGDSLTASLICWNQADHPAPHLIGMAVAVAAALTFEAKVQWPNDVVAESGRKLGGILSTVVAEPDGKRIPIVGLGMNLNQSEFGPEIAHRATSVRLEKGLVLNPDVALANVLDRLESIPVPLKWQDLAPFWRPLDSTKGKRYVMTEGVEVVAGGIGEQGELICFDERFNRHQVFAADTL